MAFSSSQVSNTLLSIIAVLLLVIVIQNSTQGRAPERMMAGMSSDGGLPHGHPPMDGPMGGPMGGGSEGGEESSFDPARMIFAALSCPEDPTMTLGDPSCRSGDADKRKQMVRNTLQENLPIPRVFDRVIEQFGENALTAEAREIRKSARAKR